MKDKWYQKIKISPEARALIGNSSNESDFSRRENIYENHRVVLCKEFRFYCFNEKLFAFIFLSSRDNKKNIKQICRGFWEDPRHLGFHFQHVTETPPLNEKIQENLSTFLSTVDLCDFGNPQFLYLGHLEIFLMDVHMSIESKKDLQNIELVCQTELQGSTTLRDLHILVCSHFCFVFNLGGDVGFPSNIHI